MNNTSVALRNFGANFLAPSLLVYVQALEKYENHQPICLAREGWFFHQLLLRLQESKRVQLSHSPVYLKVSRTLLFRAMLGEHYLWDLSLKSTFRGTLLELLRKRFGLQLHESFSVLPAEILDFSVQLPLQKSDVVTWLTPYMDGLAKIAKPTREVLANYLQQNGFDGHTKPLMLDLGYAGTIQKILSRFTQQATDGLYYISTRSDEIMDANCPRIVRHGVFYNDVTWGDSCLMLERSLLLEALLTAPHGQVVDIHKNPEGGFDFSYGRVANAQRYFQDLSLVFEGAIGQIEDWIDAGITFERDEVLTMFEVYATQPGAIPASVRHLFSLDDDFSGYGMVNSLQMFSLA